MEDTTTHAVVPIKTPSAGKRRLADALAPCERMRLIRTMLEDVVAVLLRTPGIDRVSVLTGDPSIVPPACAHLDDADLQINAALARAARALTATGAQRMLVVSADLPLVTVADIEELMAAGKTYAVVVAPDVCGTGTNALLLAPPTLIEPHFGADSLAAHLAAASRSGATVTIIRRAGLERDIDEPADVQALAINGGARYAFLMPALRAVS